MKFIKPGKKKYSKQLVPNAAVNYGLENSNATNRDPPAASADSDRTNTNPKNTAGTPAKLVNDDSATVTQPKSDPGSETPRQPSTITPMPTKFQKNTEMPSQTQPPKPENTKQVASRYTNTVISIDPSKMYASKTTNTLGNMYTTTEDEDSPQSSKAPLHTDLNCEATFEFAVQLVKRAGVMALQNNRNKSRISFTTKEHDNDVRTRTDDEVEELLVSEISFKYPNHKIIAEEAVGRSETGQVTLTDAPTWIIDPIDGTMNFVHHFPYYCISAAFLVNKVTEFGIIYNPPLDQCYTAKRGQGAWLNEESINTSGQEVLRKSLILQEYGSGMHVLRNAVNLDNANRLIMKTHALRSIGSSAMGLAMVASGAADAFFFFGLHVWDMAAGNLLVTEARGTVIDPAGGAVDIMSRRVLAAATEGLAIQLSADIIQNYPKPRDDEPRVGAEPLPLSPLPQEAKTKDFSAQTDLTDSSSTTISSTDHSQVNVKNQNQNQNQSKFNS